jgi:hypothetical protein
METLVDVQDYSDDQFYVLTWLTRVLGLGSMKLWSELSVVKTHLSLIGMYKYH